ncbi:MAG: hyaluronate lyase [Candidatus Tectimicrobiota bacterium]|nr:MAG: hyaluronate lyase [Candidatus Tectomicrobia bacterium]
MDCTGSAGVRQGTRRRGRVDVTVIGAGPAGALLAYWLAVRGLRVVLVEKARLPRVKPCGGGLTQRTVALLPFAIDAVVERRVARLVLTQNLRRPFARTSPTPLVTLVTRSDFDAFLVQQAAAAGAQVYDGCQVTAIEVQPRAFVLRSRTLGWESRYLAFADGARGTLRRRLGFAAVAPHDLGLDLVLAPPAGPWDPETLYIDWGTWPQAYAWAFPKADHWSVGVKGPAALGPYLEQYLRAFLRRWGVAPGDELAYLAHMLPTRTPDLPLVRGRALVVGDAAGLLEPFTGEGIYYAVRSAQLAAEALSAACATDAEPQAYAEAVAATLMPELEGGRALQQLFDAWPWLFHTLLRYHRRFWRAMTKILRGERGFADVQRVLQHHPYLVRALRWAGAWQRALRPAGRGSPVPLPPPARVTRRGGSPGAWWCGREPGPARRGRAWPA